MSNLTILLIAVALVACSGPESVPNTLPDLKSIGARYHQHARDFDRLVVELDRDAEIHELVCDRGTTRVSTKDEIFIDGDGDIYTAKYESLCHFARKVVAERVSRGLRFPHGFFERDTSAVATYLEWHRGTVSIANECGPDMYNSERGSCSVGINEYWSATYVWGPFCLDHMKGELGC